jgi:Mg2+ and Co2+ transporter CorA
MPTAENKEHSTDSILCIESVSKLLMIVVDERENKYIQGMDSIESSIKEVRVEIKDSLLTALSTNATALSSLDRRFETVNEFRAQLSDQQETFARKSDVESVMMAVEKATIKSEAATEKRLEGVNEFRAQLADQQATLARKTEVDIRFEGLEKKLDVALGQLQIAEGRRTGMFAVWGVMVVLITFVMSGASIVISLMSRH